MAGFTPPVQKAARLRFEHPDYEGAEVLTSLDFDLQTYLEFTKERSAEDTKVLDRLADQVRWFGDHLLIEWNITDAAGNAIPATGEGMLAIPQSFADLILSTWAATAAGRTAPLAEPSRNGRTPAPRKKAASRRKSRKRS